MTTDPNGVSRFLDAVGKEHCHFEEALPGVPKGSPRVHLRNASEVTPFGIQFSPLNGSGLVVVVKAAAAAGHGAIVRNFESGAEGEPSEWGKEGRRPGRGADKLSCVFVTRSF